MNFTNSKVNFTNSKMNFTNSKVEQKFKNSSKLTIPPLKSQVITVFSAPCYGGGHNLAARMEIFQDKLPDTDKQFTFKQFNKTVSPYVINVGK